MVANREIMTRVRSKAFVISTVILVVGILAGILISKVTRGTTPIRACRIPPLAADQRDGRSARSRRRSGVKVNTPIVASRAAGETQLRDGKLDALVTGSTGGFQVAVKKDLPDTLSNVFTVLSRQEALNEQLTQAGVDPQTVNQAVGSAQVDVQALEPKNPQQRPAARRSGSSPGSWSTSRCCSTARRSRRESSRRRPAGSSNCC